MKNTIINILAFFVILTSAFSLQAVASESATVKDGIRLECDAENSREATGGEGNIFNNIRTHFKVIIDNGTLLVKSDTLNQLSGIQMDYAFVEDYRGSIIGSGDGDEFRFDTSEVAQGVYQLTRNWDSHNANVDEVIKVDLGKRRITILQIETWMLIFRDPPGHEALHKVYQCLN